VLNGIMYLTDIEIYKVNKYKNTVEEQHLYQLELAQNGYLMNYWENIRDLFCLKLPKNFNFLDISKFNIRLGDFSGEQFERSRTGGIATFKWKVFDFDNFEKLNDEEKRFISLKYLRDALIEVCEIHNTSNTVKKLFHDICDSIQSENFELTRVFPKTTKWNKSRSLHAVTYMHHKLGGIDVNVEIRDKSGNVKLRESILKGCFWESVHFDIWRGFWNGSTFVIENKNNKIIKNLSLI
jgi:hypothetical protein